MTSTTDGRYCSACEKVVTDFTHMSDEELINFFAQRASGGSSCGHFRKDQLDKTIARPQPRKTIKFLKLAASFLMAQALFYQEQVFSKTNPPTEVVSPTDIAGEGDLKITGSVTDYHSGRALSGIKVYIEGTELYSITDKNGRFTIPLAENLTNEITLLTEYINNKNYVAGSVILAKQGIVKELTGKEIMLYRYPEEQMDEFVIVEYHEPIISGGYSTGAPMTVLHVPKETFWQRITKIFRKK